ncbi:MAG: class I SAM-dependent methyltransferase [Pseudomonadota bacterium]
MSALIDTWSKDASEEDTMTDEHAFIWDRMIACIPSKDIRDEKVLDFGCNQGGFLRLLYDSRPFASGVGVDLAQTAVAMAEQRKGNRPLRYLATDNLADLGTEFDRAFSHEVIYLIDDLEAHAKDIFAALKPGGTYDAVTCCHADSPLWATWRPMIAEFSNIPVPNHSVADITEAFRSAGFEVTVSRFMADAFIPCLGSNAYFPSDVDRIETYTQWKLSFRGTRPQV